MKKIRSETAAIALIAAFVLLAYWKVIFTGDYTYFWGADLGGQFYPWYQFAGWAWKGGGMPLWDPFTRGGMLFFEEMQPGAFYPLNIVLFLLPAHNGGVDLRSMDLLIAFSVFIAGLGEYFLLRFFRLSRASCVVGSCVLCLGGYTAYVVGHQAMFEGVIWLPWIVLPFLKALESSGSVRVRNCLVSGFFLGIAVLAGHIQPPAHTCLILGFFTLAAAMSKARTLAERVRAIGVLTGTVVFALSVAAVQLIPSYQYSRTAYRWVFGQKLDPGIRIPFELHEVHAPAEYLSLLMPSATSRQFYLGILTLFLAAAGALASSHRYRRPLVIGAILAFIYSWGASSSFYSLVCLLVPLIEKVPEASRTVFILQFFLAALAALGSDVFLRPLSRRLRWRFMLYANLALGTASIVLVSILLIALWYSRQKGIFTSGGFVAYSAAVAMLLFSAGVVFLRKHGLVRLRSLAAAIVLIVAFDLTTFVQSHTPAKKADSADRTYAEGGIVKFLRSRPPYFRVIDLDGSLPLNFGDAYRVQTTQGYGASLRKDFHDFMYARSDPAPAMRMLNVRYYIAKRDLPQMRRLFKDEQTGDSVYEDPLAVDRLAFVAGERNDGSLTLGQSLLEERISAGPGLAPTSPEAESAARIVSYEPDRISVSVRAKAAGYLWMSELVHPGWTVEVNGSPVPLLTSDLIFRAVRLGVGEHDVRFDFRPRPFYAGACITLLSCLLLAGTLLGTAVRTRRTMQARDHDARTTQG